MSRKDKQRLVLVVVSWIAVGAMIGLISDQHVRSLNHWFWTTLPSWLVILGYGIFGLIVMPVLCIGLIQSTWLCFYEPYYKWRYKGGDPKVQLQEDDWRLAGNPEFPHNRHQPFNPSSIGDSNDAFRPRPKKPGQD